MRNLLFVTLLAVFCAVALGAVSTPAPLSCTEWCDRYVSPYAFLYAQTGNVSFCGTDYKSHNTFRGSVANFTYTGCYAKRCNIGVLYPGTCGCPNNCSFSSNRGTCNTKQDQCACAKGWGGPDCSKVVCPANNCTNHGFCAKDNKGGDFCQCKDGWTGSDCSVPVPSILADRLPYGQIFPGKYYENDKYGDFHPVLNSSLVSTVRVYLSKKHLDYIFNPTNQYNQTDTDCDIFIYNAYTNEYIKDATIRLHGALGRVYNKKSFNVKFKDTFKKLTGVTLLANSFDRIVMYQMMGEFHRSMMSQTHRMSMAEVYFNDVYYGMYSMLEKINNHFQESRFDNKDNDMYKFGIYDVEYLGYNPVPYQQFKTYLYEVPRPSIIKKEGDSSWVQFVDLVMNLNASKSVRDDYLAKHFDVNRFLRAIALEAITMDYDGYSGCGNNYYLIDGSNKNTAKPYWVWAAWDFQAPLDGFNIYQTVLAYTYYNTTAAVLNQLIESGIFIPPNNISDNFLSTNPYKFIHRPEHPKPILLAVFDQPGANATYTAYMQAFLRATFANDNGLKLNSRYSAYYQLARPGLARDLFYTVDGSSISLFDASVYSTSVLINTRFAALKTLLGV